LAISSPLSGLRALIVKPGWATLVAGLSLAIPVWFGLQLLSKVILFIPDTLLTGFSWLWIGALVFGNPRYDTASFAVAQFVPVLCFFVWNPKLFSGAAHVPKRSYALFAVATVLTVLYFRSGLSDGIGYQGPKYTYAYLAANVASIGLLALIFVRNWNKQPSFRTNLLLHWILFAWLAWFAFPFVGAPVWP
jgi:hypothetical protein